MTDRWARIKGMWGDGGSAELSDRDIDGLIAERETARALMEMECIRCSAWVPITIPVLAAGGVACPECGRAVRFEWIWEAVDE